MSTEMVEDEELSRQKILAYLAGRGGSVEDPNGLGLTTEMAKAVGFERPAGLSVILAQMESDGTITRDVRGLRTYRIEAAAPAAPTVTASAVAPVAGGRARWRNAPVTEPGQWKEEVRSLPERPSTAAAPAAESWRNLEPTAQNGPSTGRRAAPRAEPAVDQPTAWERITPDWSAPESSPDWSAPQRSAPQSSAPDWSEPDWSAPAGRQAKTGRRQWWKETPNVAAPPSRSVQLIVGAAMGAIAIVAIAITLVVGMSAGKSGSVARGSGEACPLVTADEAAAALGGPSTPPADVLGSCLFENGPKKLVVAVTRDQAKAQFDAGRNDAATNVAGLGDSAYYQDGRLEVLKGDSLVAITLQPAPATATPTLTALAKAAVSRL